MVEITNNNIRVRNFVILLELLQILELLFEIFLIFSIRKTKTYIKIIVKGININNVKEGEVKAVNLYKKKELIN